MRPLIGFLLKTYPKLSETFILNEILELERQGINLHIFSLRQPTDGRVHPGVEQVKAPVTYIPTVLPEFDPDQETALIEANLTLFKQDGCAYLQALEFYLSRHEDRRLHEFLQGGYLALQLQQLGIAHLHVHFANVPAATAEIAQMLSSVPYSITAHAKDIYLTDAAALDRRISKAEFVLTCTDFNRQHLEAISTSRTPIHLAYHGLDLLRFQPCAAAAKDEMPLILSVGRFCEKKGFPYLLRACQILQQVGLEFRCAIVGWGPLEAEMRQQISDLGLEKTVMLVGKLTQDSLVDYYRRASLFVLPCLVTDQGDRDGIPNVLLEAMAMELPVVSTDVSGISELVHSGVNGTLVSEKDEVSLAQAIEALLRQPQLRAQLGQRGRQTVLDNFALAQNVGQVKDWLLQAVQSPHRPRVDPLTRALPSEVALLGELLAKVS